MSAKATHNSLFRITPQEFYHSCSPNSAQQLDDLIVQNLAQRSCIVWLKPLKKFQHELSAKAHHIYNYKVCSIINMYVSLVLGKYRTRCY